MPYFGERAGAASYSRNRLIRRQAKRLLTIAEAGVELPGMEDFTQALAQAFVNRRIILEQFPFKRIKAAELAQLADIGKLMRKTEDTGKSKVVEKACDF